LNHLRARSGSFLYTLIEKIAFWLLHDAASDFLLHLLLALFSVNRNPRKRKHYYFYNVGGFFLEVKAT
jgi:hypothetical protein